MAAIKGGGFGWAVSPGCDSHLLREDTKFSCRSPRRKDAKQFWKQQKKTGDVEVLDSSLLDAKPRQEVGHLGDILKHSPKPNEATAQQQSAVEAESKPAEKKT